MGIKIILYSRILNVDMVCRFRNMIPSRSWPLNRGYLTGGISSNTPDLEVKIDSKIISETGKPTFRFKGSDIGNLLKSIRHHPDGHVLFPDLGISRFAYGRL